MTEEMPRAVASVQIDNDRVRVTEWRFAPGAQTGWHVHAMDYIVVPGTTGPLTIVDENGKSARAPLEKGVSYFRRAGVRHNVINGNDTPFSFVEIELKGATASDRG